MAWDSELSAFLSGEEDDERDTVCTKSKTSGHGSASCPDSPKENVPLYVPIGFSEAFPRSKKVYEHAVAASQINVKCVKRLDLCLTAVLKSECAPESTPPMASVPPTPAEGDKPVEEQTNVTTRRKDPEKLTPPTIDLTTSPRRSSRSDDCHQDTHGRGHSEQRRPEAHRRDVSGSSFYKEMSARDDEDLRIKITQLRMQYPDSSRG